MIVKYDIVLPKTMSYLRRAYKNLIRIPPSNPNLA